MTGDFLFLAGVFLGGFAVGALVGRFSVGWWMAKPFRAPPAPEGMRLGLEKTRELVREQQRRMQERGPLSGQPRNAVETMDKSP